MSKEKSAWIEQGELAGLEPQSVLVHLPIGEDSVILDLACGSGAGLRALASLCPQGKIYAFDPREDIIDALMNEVMAHSFTRVIPRVAKPWSIPLGNGSVDICILASPVIGAVKPDSEARLLHEIGRVLKPDGLLAVLSSELAPHPSSPAHSPQIGPLSLAGQLCSQGFTSACKTEIRLTEKACLGLYHPSQNGAHWD